MIKIDHLSKAYSSKLPFAVNEVSLTVEDGSIAGLIGPNGSGKTTLLKTVCGFHFPTKGNVFIENKPIDECTKECLNQLGYVSELPLLPPQMTVRAFLKYAGLTHGIKENSIEERISFVTKECSLEAFLDKKIKTISKGQKQRVSFAQALIHDPKNLILDEPVSGLDPAQIIQMRTLIKKLSKNKAILLSTHILQEIYSLCDQLYVLNKGQLVAAGTEKQIIETAGTKNLEEAFLKLTGNSAE